jgi:ABC-type glutathione transport system ATPase component
MAMEGAQITLTNFSIDIVTNKSDESTTAKGKRLLHPVNASIEGGCLFGILGGSGSGKVCFQSPLSLSLSSLTLAHSLSLSL